MNEKEERGLGLILSSDFIKILKFLDVGVFILANCLIYLLLSKFSRAIKECEGIGEVFARYISIRVKEVYDSYRLRRGCIGEYRSCMLEKMGFEVVPSG
ncbi:MAG TPA: hypothetical protein ENI49_05545 [Thermoplasmatales archaeon]|nr:hypothetical protein [Thermoplasmatales archaeon]